MQTETNQTEAQAETTAEKKPSVLKNANFRSLMLAQLVSNIGESMHGLALIWLMNVLTDGSALWLSLIAVAQVVPRVLLAPFSGVLVDRWPKLLTMRCSDLFSAASVGGIAALAYSGVVEPWHLLVLAFLTSSALNFFIPAKQTLLVKIVDGEQLMGANSLSQTIQTLSILFGPVVSGILIGTTGSYLVFAIQAGTFLLSFVFLNFIRYKEPKGDYAKLDSKTFFREMGEGFAVIRDIDLLRALIPFGIFINFLLAPLSVFITLLVTKTYGGGAAELGYLESALGLGMLIGSIATAVMAAKLRKSIIFYVGTFGMAAMITLLAFTNSTWQGIACAALVGFFVVMSNLALQTVVQQAVPVDKMGRVMTLMATGMQGMQPLSNLLFGALLNTYAAWQLLAFVGGAFGIGNLAMLKPKAIRELK